MNELKPCPICGSELRLNSPEDWKSTYNDPDSGGDPYGAYCDCGFNFCNFSYEWDEFIKAANTRTA